MQSADGQRRSSGCSISSRIPKAAITARRSAIRVESRGTRRLDRDLFPAGARRALPLAPGRRRRGLALLRRRAARARRSARRQRRRSSASGSAHDLAAGERPQAVVPAHVWQAAVVPRRLDAGRLHGRPGLPVLALRTRAARMDAARCCGRRQNRLKALRRDPSHHDLPAIGGQGRAGDEAASSEARNSTQRAISSGSPSRPIGISGRIDFSSTSFGTACTISVLM